MKYIFFFLSIYMHVLSLNAMEQGVNPYPAEIKFGLPKRTSRPQNQLPNQPPMMPRSPKTEERLQSFSLGRRPSGGNKTLPTQSNPGSQT